MSHQTHKELTLFFGFTFVFSWLFWLPGVLTYLGIIDAPAGLLKLLELIGAIGPHLNRTTGRQSQAKTNDGQFVQCKSTLEILARRIADVAWPSRFSTMPLLL